MEGEEERGKEGWLKGRVGNRRGRSREELSDPLLVKCFVLFVFFNFCELDIIISILKTHIRKIKKASMVFHVCNLRDKAIEADRSLGLTGQPSCLAHSKPVRDLSQHEPCQL